MECLIVNFVDKIVQFLAQRLHGYTCNRNHFKRDAEEKHLIFPSSLPFLSKNPLFKGVSKDSSLTSSLTYPSHDPSHRHMHKSQSDMPIPFHDAGVLWERWREGNVRDM